MSLLQESLEELLNNTTLAHIIETLAKICEERDKPEEAEILYDCYEELEP